MLPPGSRPSYAYIRNSVLAWFAAADIEVVPIPPFLNDAEVRAYFESVQGLYLHPDWATHPAYNRMIRLFLHLAIEANRSGDHFPVWGTCLGYESMMQHMAPFKELERFDARRVHWSEQPLRIRETPRSRLLAFARPVERKHLVHVYRPYYDHDYGISVGRFGRLKELNRTFRILATSHDRAGREYVALVEGRSLPFYGSQFHPDQDAHGPNDLHWIALFLRAELRKSRHRGPDPAMLALRDMRKGRCLGEMGYAIPCFKIDLHHTG